MRAPGFTSRHDQRGVVLVISILLLLVMTILAISMFRSYGSEEKIAGNTRDKERAFNAAVSAQQFAEYWLSSNSAPVSAACTGVVNSNIGQVCTNPIPNLNTLPWAAGVTYTQFTSTPINGVTNTLSLAATPTPGSYYAAPVFYIQDLGADVQGEVYLIDAVGYGGSPNSVAIVESTYLISQNTAKSPDK